MYSLRFPFPFQGSEAKEILARRVIHRIAPCDRNHYSYGFLKHERISLLRGLSFVSRLLNAKLDLTRKLAGTSIASAVGTSITVRIILSVSLVFCDSLSRLFFGRLRRFTPNQAPVRYGWSTAARER